MLNLELSAISLNSKLLIRSVKTVVYTTFDAASQYILSFWNWLAAKLVYPEFVEGLQKLFMKVREKV